MTQTSPRLILGRLASAGAIMVAATVAMTVLSGCQTPVAGSDLSGFASGAAAVSRQAAISFAEGNRLARSVSVERFIRSGRPGLAEDQFQVAVRPADVAAWQQSLSALEEYGNGIASLVDGGRPAVTGDLLKELAGKLNGGVVGANISPSLATGFAALGAALVRQAADRTARDLLARADPAIQNITSTMADAIGGSDSEGLRGTVSANWADAARGTRESYLEALEAKNLDRQRAAAKDYLSILDKRDAQLTTLAGLAASLRGLGAAHAAAAAGSPASFNGLLSIVQRRADETLSAYETMRAREAGDGGAKQ